MKELFGRYTISWQSAFYYFQKWSKDGSWHKLFTSLSDANLRMLNLFVWFLHPYLRNFMKNKCRKNLEYLKIK